MYNSETPLHVQLPTSRQLTRSTLIAAVCAAALLAIVVLPAEYGIDPTGIGSRLGLDALASTEAGDAEDLPSQSQSEYPVHAQLHKLNDRVLLILH